MTQVIHSFREKKNYRLLGRYFLLALLLFYLMEALSRQSLWQPFLFAYERPLACAFNFLILYFCLCLALLFRRRGFCFLLIFGTWLGVAIANFVLLRFRSMPLTARDILLISSVKDIFEIYLNPLTLVLLMLMISALWGLIFCALLLTKKREELLGLAIGNCLLIAVLLCTVQSPLVNRGAIDATAEFQNLSEAYHRNGFAYCFCASAVTRGVEEPGEYSSGEVEEILDEQATELPSTEEGTPNIVFVQLESFFDPGYMKALSYETDPIPVFRMLKNRRPSGLLSVPCVGAGTANTEFEVLTGMNLSHFGVGEYPYTTIVDIGETESIATALSSIGYATHAIHNNNASFYDRHIVYDNFSFDTFTSLEYMDDVEYNPLGWAKDQVLTSEILKCLESGKDKDFVFAVSVQAHGRYPKKPIDGAQTLSVSGMPEEDRRAGFEYYLQQLWETDRFIGELRTALSKFPEKTMVVFYGDHLPSFSIENEELSAGSNQTTEYVIWTNYPLVTPDRDLQTYQLSAYILELCGIHEGAVFKHHQSYSYGLEDHGSYQEDLQTLEYDMLYGENFAADEPEQTDTPGIRFDVETILLRDLIAEGEEDFLIVGEHFTPFSRVYVNDRPYPTEFISSTTLRVKELRIEKEDVVSVVQVSSVDELHELSRSNTLTVETDLTE